MKIAQSSLQLSSTHVTSQYHEVSESLRMWVDRQPDAASGKTQQPSAQVQISDAGQAAQASDSVQAQQDAIDKDPKMSLIRTLVEFLTGKPIRMLDARALFGNAQQSADTPASTPQTPSNGQATAQPASQSAGYGVEYDYHEVYAESEQTSFAASGTVQTADGKSISFNIELQMSRSYYQESSASLRLGDAAVRKDPLVVNFAGNAAQLTDSRFAFDLNGDGQNENIHFATGGSGFLAFDRNGNGKIDNGSELFGPGTGNGFAELAQLDSDHNGWIDENDAAWKDLRVLSKDASGKDKLQTLAAAGVGALSLGAVATPFDLKDDANQLKAHILASGVYLSEDGQAGTLQQLDLTV